MKYAIVIEKPAEKFIMKLAKSERERGTDCPTGATSSACKAGKVRGCSVSASAITG